MREEEFYYQEFGYMPPEEHKRKWTTLLLHALRKGNIVEFIIKDTKSLPSSLEPFRPNLIKVFSVYWKYGLKRRRPVAYARFSLSDELKNFLMSRTIGKWGEGYPADPAIYKDNVVLLWTIAHDYMAFVRLSDGEAVELNKQGLSLEKVKVRPPYPPQEV